MGEAQDVARDRVTVQEATERVGVKEDAIRKRIQRGSIRHQKTPDGRMWVWVPPAQGKSQDTTAEYQDESQVASRYAAQDERIEDLKEQVAYLRRQLDEEREARRRADVILGQLSQANVEQTRTIQALEAPAEVSEQAPGDAEAVEEAPEAEPRPATGGA